MAYQLKYHPDVKRRDLPRIDSRNKAIVRKAIEEKLLENPEVFAMPLRRTLKGYWKLRVGSYRVVFGISGETIRIYAILHRKEVYSTVGKRL